MVLRVDYVDGRTIFTPPELWPAVRGDGVDRVTVECATGSRVAQGHSLYWLYPEGATWVVGEASVRYSNEPIVEVVIGRDGVMVERHVSYMPDVRHGAVKLGWWRPGEARPDG